MQIDPLITSEESNELFNSILHIISAVLAIAGMIVLIVFSAILGNNLKVVTFSVYGASLILTFVFSSILHMFLAFRSYHRVFGILDHDAIYVLIAGTYTPFSLVVVGGTAGLVMFLIIWALAALNIVLKSVFFARMGKTFSMVGYIVMGWISVTMVYFIYLKLGLIAILMMLLGGILYTAGSIVFATEKPKLFKNFGSHELWHLMVSLGSLCFYFIMLFYVLPF